MRIKLRLGGVKDADLIALHVSRDFDLPQNIRKALRYYVGRQSDKIILPHDVIPSFSTEPIAVNIPLNDVYDADIIQFLKELRIGYRSSAIKAIFRHAVERPYIEAFSDCSTIVKPIYTITKQSAQEPQKDNHSIKQSVDETARISETHREQTVPDETQNNAEETWDLFSEDGFVENY